MKKVASGLLLALSIILTYGVVGGMERGTCPLVPGVILCVLCFVSMFVALYHLSYFWWQSDD